MTKDEIVSHDLNGLYDSGARDFYDDCRELLALDDTPKVRQIFEKACSYAFGSSRFYWLEAFEDWIEVMDE